ncbi:ER membrane protein complex subunit-like protein [Tasmannia lanceolata]|uniref:ER membrane protein complex subunit-like protein n=1 Tax=Tasmannia lanceolata TaxID=3420 RepID=UPI00406440C0
MGKNQHLSLLLLFFFFYSLFLRSSSTFQSDELLHDDEEFGLEGVRSPDLEYLQPIRPTIRKRSDHHDSSSSSGSDSKIQFSLEHAFGDSDFSPAGTFTARLKTLNHGGQTLTKLRFSRNDFTENEKENFKKLLKDDEFYRIRVPSNVLSPPGKDYVISSVKARCLPRESLDEHFVIHMDGVNILAVNYGSAGACQYPRLLKLPAKWSFNSYTVLKNSEQAPRTPSFAEEILLAEEGEGEGVKPPERSFWAKYWMYAIPLGLIVMNAMTQAMNMPEEQAAGQPGSQAGQPVTQRAPNPAVRRR